MGKELLENRAGESALRADSPCFFEFFYYDYKYIWKAGREIWRFRGWLLI